MPIYAVSARVGPTSNREERLRSLVEKVAIESVGPYWSDGDQLFIMESPKSAVDLSYFLMHGTALNPKYDRVSVISLSAKDYASNGVVENPRVLRLLMERR